ncbi:MAG: hypothetical protein ACTHMM_18335 [Agriterribacter sp.]
MGCDIHLFVEYKRPGSERWVNYGKEFRLDRIYGLFARLAGVRSHKSITPVAAGRGVPEDAAMETIEGYTYFISDEKGYGYITQEKADEWVSKGYSKYVGDGKYRITNSDRHSHSWATAEEFEKAVSETFFKEGKWMGDYSDYKIMVELLAAIKREDFEVRVVFFFDN